MMPRGYIGDAGALVTMLYSSGDRIGTTTWAILCRSLELSESEADHGWTSLDQGGWFSPFEGARVYLASDPRVNGGVR